MTSMTDFNSAIKCGSCHVSRMLTCNRCNCRLDGRPPNGTLNRRSRQYSRQRADRQTCQSFLSPSLLMGKINKYRNKKQKAMISYVEFFYSSTVSHHNVIINFIITGGAHPAIKLYVFRRNNSTIQCNSLIIHRNDQYLYI